MTGGPRLPGALLWDFDGLILDTETAAYEVSAQIFAEHGARLGDSDWAQLIGTATLHWTEVLAGALGTEITPADKERLSLLRQQRHRELLTELPAQPGVDALLEEAARAGVPCAVASSSTDAWVEEHLERLGRRAPIDLIVTRDLVGPERTKPHPDLFLAAATGLDVPPERCVVLEDSPNGVLAAQAAGIPVVAVPAGITAELAFPAADLVVPSLAEVDLAALGRLVPPHDGTS